MKRVTALLLILVCVLAMAGCFKTEGEKTVRASKDNPEAAATNAQTEPVAVHTLDCKTLQEACAESFIDPSRVTVLGGEWAYSADPEKFVALATVRYTDKDDEYETAEFVMVGTFGGKTELFHNLNEHSPYTRENALQAFGAADDRRFPLE